MTALRHLMEPTTSCSLARQFSPEPVSAELDELYTLLRATSTSMKQRALDIISGQSPEDLFLFMQQLLQHPGTVPSLSAQCRGAYTALDAIEETPDSPKRLAPATDQMMLSPSCSSSKVNNTSRAFDSFTEGDVLQLPNSPVQRLRGDHGPCDSRLLQSLDLNLGASFDLLSKASLADFSSAAAAASRMSTTALVRQSHMRVLSPVAESSFMSAADAQQEISVDSSEDTLELPADAQQGLYSSSTSSQQQQRLSDGYSFSTHTPGVKAPDAADADLSPSTCSSPRDPAAGAAAAAASALRMSVAESAHDWPSSLPLPLAVLEADTGHAADAPAAAVQAPLQMQRAAAGHAPAAAAAAHSQALAGTSASAIPQAAQQQHSVLSTPSSAATAGAVSKTNSTATTPKRSGGPNPLGLITAPIHGANALRRSITRLWGGNKGSSKAKAPATAALPSKQAPRSLACASAPMSAVYGGAASSKLPCLKQSPSPALLQPMQGFGVTQQGSSPTKAAAAAVAASAASSSKKAAASAARTPQRTSGNIGYRPPTSAGRGTPTGAVASPLGSTAASAGVTSRIPGSAGSSSGYSRAGSTGPSSRQQGTLQQRAQYGLDRPSSQASNMSYARSDASLTGTGSHTSAGPFQGGFQATRQALQGKATPTLKQPASRLQHKQQVTRAVSNAAATVAAAQAGSSSSRGIRGAGGVSGIPGGQQGMPGFSRQAMTAAGHQFQSRSQLPQPPSGGQSGGSRIGGGARSQLRRSRSCGSLAEMLNVAELRSMWQQREQETAPQRLTAAAAAGATAKHGLRHQHNTVSAGGAAAAMLQGQSSIGRGTGGRQPQLGGKPTSYQPPSRLPEAAGGDGEDEGGLPVLSRCQSPTRLHGQDRSHGVCTSQVLAEMGHVLSHMDTLIAGDTTSTLAPAAGSATGRATQAAGNGGSWGSGLEPRQQPGALGVGQSPSALVYKLVKGTGAGSAAATPAADRRAVHAAGGLAHGTQQMLLTPPARLPATADDVNPVASPDESPSVSGGSSQVSHAGLPRWNVYSAPPAAAVTAGSAVSSQELLMSQEGQDLSRQLF